MQLSLKFYLVTFVWLLSLVFADVSITKTETSEIETSTSKNETGIIDTIKSRLYMTKTRAAMLLTAGIAYESSTVLDVYKRCSIHSGHYISGEDCFYAVRGATIRWSVELLALNVINHWSKKELDNIAKDESSQINRVWYSSFRDWYNYIL